MFKAIFNWLKQPTARWGGAAIGVIGTAAFLFVFFQGVAYTNTMEFCTSCHSMTFPYEEYKKSAHFKNAVGVQAGCPDCHVPHDYPDLLIAKVLAVKKYERWSLEMLISENMVLLWLRCDKGVANA